jgi:hypothetical protein
MNKLVSEAISNISMNLLSGLKAYWFILNLKEFKRWSF